MTSFPWSGWRRTASSPARGRARRSGEADRAAEGGAQPGLGLGWSPGVIQAEQGAIDHYTKIIKTCEGVDFVTADMVTTILADEEEHLRTFEGFLKEYDRK